MFKNKKNSFSNTQKTPKKSEKILVTDIQVPITKKIENISKKVIGIKEYKSQSSKIFAFSWRFFFVVFFSFYILIGISPFDILQKTFGAFQDKQTIKIFPKQISQSELGVWENINDLEKANDLPSTANLGEFTENNSAFLKQKEAELFVSGFDYQILNTSLDNISTSSLIQIQTEEKDENATSSNPLEEDESLINSDQNASTTEENKNLENDTLLDSVQVEEEKNEGLEEENLEILDSENSETQVLEKNEETLEEVSSELENSSKDSQVNTEQNEPVSVSSENNDISFLGKVKNYFQAMSVFAEEVLDKKIEQLSDLGNFQSAKIFFSGAGTIEKIEDNKSAKIIISYSLARFDFNSQERVWRELVVLDSEQFSNQTNNGYFSYEAPFLESWEDVSDLQIKINVLNPDNKNLEFYLDAFWLEAEFIEETQERIVEKRERGEDAISPLFLDESLISSDIPYRFVYRKKQEEKFSGIINELQKTNFWDDVDLKVRLENDKQEILDVNLILVLEDDGEFSVRIPTESNLTPGKYNFVFSVLDNTSSQVEVLNIEKDFSFGLLAFNTNKTIYHPYEIAYGQMAVLDNNGHTLCDASIELKLTMPDGETRVYDTKDSIARNPLCGPDNVIDSPDYYLYFDLAQVGEYNIELIATTTVGVRKITEKIIVQDNIAFDIERVGPTRIYPKALYQMGLEIKANQDFSGNLLEYFPKDFLVENIKVEIFDQALNFFVAYDFAYDKERIDNEKQRIVFKNINLKKEDRLKITYEIDAPDISPEFYLLGPLEMKENDNLVFSEKKQWQIASDANVFRITEYYLTTGQFTGTTYDLTLNQDLADDYFIMVRGSRIGSGASVPDNDYARVYRVPDARGDLADSGADNVISLSRYVADFNWEGVVTVVECLADQDQAGFRLLDIAETAMVGTATSGSSTIATNWSDINKVVPFGGYRAGGAEFEADATNGLDGDVVYTRLWPSGANTLNWTRMENQGVGLLKSATISTFVVEWGSQWTVQRAYVEGNKGANGANVIAEYTTANIDQVNRDNTWVWGTGMAIGDGVGEDAEGAVITIGDGVNKNVTENKVAVGAEYVGMRYFDVYTISHPKLAVDHRFKIDGDSTLADIDVLINEAFSGQRLSTVYNGCGSTNSSHPRNRFWSRYTADNFITISRGYSGLAFPAWVQGVDFSLVQYAPPRSLTKQKHFRWKDDNFSLSESNGWLTQEDEELDDFAEKNENYRLRIEVSNEGSISESASRQYELQWGRKTSACADIVVWRGLEDYNNDAFAVSASSHINNNENISTALLANLEDLTFSTQGQAMDSTDTSSGINPIASTTYIELEYSIKATENAIAGADYCFRLYDKASSTLDAYDVYPELTIDFVPSGQIISEWGVAGDVSDDNWHLVDFSGIYVEPIFVCSLEYGNNIGNEADADANSVVCRVRNLSATSTQIRLQEAGEISGTLSRNEDVHWIVVEKGVYNTDEFKMEAFSYNSVITDARVSWVGQAQSYGQTYTTPVVLGQVMSYNDVNFSSFYARGTAIANPPIATSLYTGKHIGEDTINPTRANETIGVIVIEQTHKSMLFNEYEAFASTGKLIDRIDDRPIISYKFNQAFSATPQVAIISQAGIRNNEGPIPMLYTVNPLTQTHITPIIAEDEIIDTEMTGTTEDVHYLVFKDAGSYVADDVFLNQDTYRFYANANSVQPGSALANENEKVLEVADGDIVRLRLGIQAGITGLLLSDRSFKLQYGQGDVCSSITDWNDVDGSAGSGIWRAYINSIASDGSQISSSLLNNGLNKLESYEEENNSVKNLVALAEGERGEWDWVLENNGAEYGVDYCFRVVLNNNSLIKYDYYPQLRTKAVEISGTVYSDEGLTPILNSPIVSLRINGEFIASTTASFLNGSFLFSGISQIDTASSVLLYLDNSSAKAVSINRYQGEGDISDADLYQNKIIIRHDDDGPVTENDLSYFDANDDTDLGFTSSPFSVSSGFELIVRAGDEFSLDSDEIVFDDVRIKGNLVARDNQKIIVNGNWDASSGNFQASSGTVEFNSSQAGNTIFAHRNSFANLIFKGGGSWTLIDDATSTATTTIEDGTLILGDDVDFVVQSLVIKDGANFSGAAGAGKLIFESEQGGVLRDENVVKNNLGNIQVGYSPSTTTLESDILVNDLIINATDVLETNGYDVFASGTISVYGLLNCQDNGEADSSVLTIDGDFFVDNVSGDFRASDSLLVFSGDTDAFLNSGGYSLNNLTIAKNNATTTIVEFGLDLADDLTIENNAYFDVSENNYDINIAGSWENNGVFRARAGTVVFDANDLDHNVRVGNSAFYNVEFDNIFGGWTVLDNATSSNNWLLNNADNFSVNSNVTIEVLGIFSNEISGADTSWNQSTLFLNGDSVTINSKAKSDDYYNLKIGDETNIKMWNSQATNQYLINSSASSSLYSMDHAGVDGELYIWGNYIKTVGTDYWSYANDFDGIDITASPRQAKIYFADSSRVEFNGARLNMIGSSTSLTLLDRMDSNYYDLEFNGGIINANYYQIKNISSQGLTLLSNTNVVSLDNGHYYLANNDGSLITVASTTIDNNSAKKINNCEFVYEAGITQGYNVSLEGNSLSYWSFEFASGALAGEDFDNEAGGDCGSIRFGDSDCSLISQKHFRWRNDNNVEATASWKAGEDIAITSQKQDENVRLRFSLDNIGTSDVNGVNYQLQIAQLTNYENCEAVPAILYTNVATTSSVNVHAVMTTSSRFDNTTLTTNQLTNEGTFSAGYMVEYPNSKAGEVSLGIGAFTELEYNFEFTNNSLKNNTYCFRVNANGVDLSEYLKVAQLKLEGITVSGTIKQDEVGTAWSACDGSTQNLSLVVNGNLINTRPCEAGTGIYYFNDVALNQNDVVAVFVNTNGSNTDKGVMLTKVNSISSNITMNFITNRIILKQESGISQISNSDLAYCDNNNGVACANVPYNIESSKFILETGKKLILDAGVNFVPGGDIETSSSSLASEVGGDILIKSGATLDVENNDIIVGGAWQNDGAYVFGDNATIYFQASTTGHLIEAGSSSFYNLVFDGNGSWAINENAIIENNLEIKKGEITGTASVSVFGGDVWGDGVLNFTQGTFMVDNDGVFGGASDWNFYNLNFGDGLWSRVTEKVGANKINILNQLTISTSQTLQASSSIWNLAGAGNPLIINGFLDQQSSTIIYSATANTNILARNYFDLKLSPSGAGSPVFTILAGDLAVNNDWQIGDGINVITIDVHNLANLLVSGDFTINSKAIFNAPNTGTFTVSSAWENLGTFNHNNGKVIFDSTNLDNTITASSSSFYDLEFNNNEGAWEIGGSLTVDHNFDLLQANNFSIATSQVAWYNENWLYRKKITIDSSMTSGEVLNIPIVINITDADLSLKAKVNGDDILFTASDGRQKISHEIESYNQATGALTVWVLAPSLSASSDSEIYLYYGNADALNQEDKAGLWEDFAGVWHLKESPNGVLDQIKDSTTKGHEGTTRNMEAVDSIDAKVGKGLSFDGVNERIPLKFSYAGVNAIPSLTACSWFNTTYVGTNYTYNMSLFDFDNSDYFSFYIGGISGEVYFATYGIGGTKNAYTIGRNFNDGAWHHACVVYDGVDKRIYVDGVLETTQLNPHLGDSLGSANTRFAYIGDGSEATSFDSRGNNIYYQGYIDELQYSQQAFSADWIITSFRNQNNSSSYLSVDEEELESTSENYVLEVKGVFNNQLSEEKTNWTNATIYLNGTSQIINNKTSSGDDYMIMRIGDNTQIKMWNSSVVSAEFGTNASLYSMDHNQQDGYLYIWGNYERNSGIEYWNYANDFDGANLSSTPRKANIKIQKNSSVSINNSELQMRGVTVSKTSVDNQGVGNYSLSLNNSSLNAEYYSLANLDIDGLKLENSSLVKGMDYGDFELAVNGGSMLSLDTSTFNNNPLEIINNCKFSLKGDITSGYNIKLVGTANTAWIIRNHTGDYDGEAYDSDAGDPRGYLIWDDSPEYTPKSRNWRWYYDVEQETPISQASSEENVTPIIGPANDLKLRMTIQETEGLLGDNVKLRLQYSTYADFSQDVFFVGEQASSSSAFVYADGIDTDGSIISTKLMSDSSVLGTHNESGISTSTFDHNLNTAVEWEFTLKNRDAVIGQTYYFRAYAKFFSVYDTFEKVVSLYDSESYPSVIPADGNLAYEMSGLANGSSTEGVITNIETSPGAIQFGNLMPNSEIIGAHRFFITTNASNGYRLVISQRQKLISENGADINDIEGTNESPIAWPDVFSQSVFGYHPSDDTLSGASPSRFANNNSYAKFDTQLKEVSFSSIPVTNEAFDLVFRIKTDELQEAGEYETEIMYLLIPSF